MTIYFGFDQKVHNYLNTNWFLGILIHMHGFKWQVILCKSILKKHCGHKVGAYKSRLLKQSQPLANIHAKLAWYWLWCSLSLSFLLHIRTHTHKLTQFFDIYFLYGKKFLLSMCHLYWMISMMLVPLCSS